MARVARTRERKIRRQKSVVYSETIFLRTIPKENAVRK